MSISGKHALVTGGGTGIGLAIAQDLWHRPEDKIRSLVT